MRCIKLLPYKPHAAGLLLSAAERGNPLLLSASVCDNSGNSPQMSAPMVVIIDVGTNNSILLILDDTLNRGYRI